LYKNAHTQKHYAKQESTDHISTMEDKAKDIFFSKEMATL